MSPRKPLDPDQLAAAVLGVQDAIRALDVAISDLRAISGPLKRRLSYAQKGKLAPHLETMSPAALMEAVAAGVPGAQAIMDKRQAEAICVGALRALQRHGTLSDKPLEIWRRDNYRTALERFVRAKRTPLAVAEVIDAAFSTVELRRFYGDNLVSLAKLDRYWPRLVTEVGKAKPGEPVWDEAAQAYVIDKK
jgi:hypothetical protein